MIRRLVWMPIVLLLALASPAAARQDTRIDVRMDVEQANAVLGVLAKRAASQPITQADWSAIFRTAGYTRLARREQSMRRPFTDSAFRAFVLSDSLLARRDALARTLAAWQNADVTGAARRAFTYLPTGATLEATIYPVIKPATNSFVFELDTDRPAIFLYLDPAQTAAQFENVLAHELHHVGIARNCPDPVEPDATKALALRWLGAFAEGIAMLAAAGGPDVHPHATSAPEDRARWDRDLQNAPRDMREVETFFTDILQHRLQGDSVTARGMAFFGVQGPWYTLGWLMASTVERHAGRETLASAFCDLRHLLRAYNDAARALDREGRQLPQWSDEFLAALGG